MSFVFTSHIITGFTLLISVIILWRLLKLKKQSSATLLASAVFFIFCQLFFWGCRKYVASISIFDVILFALICIILFILYKSGDNTTASRDTIDRYTLLEKMQQGFFVVNAQGKVLDYNQVGKNVLSELGASDISLDSNIFQIFKNIFPSFDFNPAQHQDKEQIVELTLERMVGQKLHFFELEIGYISDGKKGEDFLIFIHDTTEAQEQQLDLLTFRAAFYAMDDMMLICSPKGFIEYASAGFTKNTGYTEPEVQDIYFPDLKIEDDEVFSSIKKALDNNERWDGYVKSLKKNGREMLEKMTISPIFDSERKLAGLAVVSKDVTAEYSQIEQLEREAGEDFLTQISNRRTFMFLATEMIETANKTQQSAAILMMDIDFFKRINDTYGHDAGDITLKTLANLLKKLIRKSDLLARYGGEEFILMVSGITETNVLRMAERFRNEAEKLVIPYEDKEIRLTVSIGICFAQPQEDPQNEPQISDLIHRADEALYRAKNLGRNRVELWQNTAENC